MQQCTAVKCDELGYVKLQNLLVGGCRAGLNVRREHPIQSICSRATPARSTLVVHAT